MRLLVAILVAAAVALTAPAAVAKRSVTWTKVDVRDGDDATRVGKTLRKMLKSATRKAKWGKKGKLELSARVTKLSWETRDDVALIHVTVVAKIAGGKGARSKIRIGGRPDEKRKLEKEALHIVANGLVTRLSDIARRTQE